MQGHFKVAWKQPQVNISILLAFDAGAYLRMINDIGEKCYILNICYFVGQIKPHQHAAPRVPLFHQEFVCASSVHSRAKVKHQSPALYIQTNVMKEDFKPVSTILFRTGSQSDSKSIQSKLYCPAQIIWTFKSSVFLSAALRSAGRIIFSFSVSWNN